jgi:hypothetical protein
MDEIISYKMCAVKVRNAKLRNYLKQFFLYLRLFSSYTLSKTRFRLVPSPYCDILAQFFTFKTAIELKDHLKDKKTVKNSYMRFFVSFLMMQVIFVVILVSSVLPNDLYLY